MEKMTLLKYLVNAGLGSRRSSFQLIKEGRIQVNEKFMTNPLYPVQKGDQIYFQNKALKLEKDLLEPVYILMNKPKGYVCSVQDEEEKPNILRLIKHKNLTRAHIYPVGRLDFLTEGLLFITNDGQFANYLTHPRYNVLKDYYVEIKGPLQEKEIKQMKKGIYSNEMLYKVINVKVLSANEKLSRLVITLNEGRNREIRNIFAILKHKIKILRRIKIGPFTLPKDLMNGDYRLIPRKIIQKFKDSFAGPEKH